MLPVILFCNALRELTFDEMMGKLKLRRSKFSFKKMAIMNSSQLPTNNQKTLQISV